MSLTANVALILAAGNGSRIAAVSGPSPKPLVSLHGRPLLEHALLSARDAGIERFVIVAGYRAHAIHSWVTHENLFGVRIEVVDNLQYNKANGISVLKARQAIQKPFLLLMADHVFETQTAAALLQQPLEPDGVILAVDSKLDRIFDMDDATKVLRSGDYILDIGKRLTRYDAVDTGMFLCSPAVFSALDRATVNGDCSLSAGMRLLAQEAKLRAFDIGNARWQDVDTPEALAHAEVIFAEQYWPEVDFEYA